MCLIKVLEKHTQCHLFLYPVFYVFSMNAQKLLYPLINHMLEVLRQVKHGNTVKSLGEIHKNGTHKSLMSQNFLVFYKS